MPPGLFFSMIGQALAHYHILSKIDAGELAEVYRAYDGQLERDVALKILPAGLLPDSLARELCRAEALALARLNHPNIETTYEFDSQDGVDFLVMELVHGNTLAAMLEVGRLPEKETFRLGAQLAEGLAAAHACRVVHRHLRPTNVLVTAEGHLKILDVGLARLFPQPNGSDPARTLGESQAASATLPYIAPEQLRGGPVDQRADIYSVGALLYEMATGRRPFPQTYGPDLIESILNEWPSPPSAHNRRMHAGLETIIIKALEKRPERRYQSARELLTALENVAAGHAPHLDATPSRPAEEFRGAPAPARSARPYFWVFGAVALLAAILAGLGFGSNFHGWRDQLFALVQSAVAPSAPAKSSAGAESAPAVPVRRSVAVIGLRNLSGLPEKAWLSTALSEMLTTELAAGEQVRTVPGEAVGRMMAGLGLRVADNYDSDTLARIRNNLGADDVLCGSYLAPAGEGGGQIRVDLRLLNAATGEALAAISEKGTEKELFKLVAWAEEELRSALQVSPLTPTQAAGARAVFPSNPEAARLYADGLEKLRAFDSSGALSLLQKSATLEPDSAVTHAALASAWTNLGEDVKALDEAKKAAALSMNLSLEDRLLNQGRALELASDWGNATDIFRTLFDAFPDNLEFGLRLARAQDSARRPQEALATLARLRRLPPPSGSDPRIDLIEASSAALASDYRKSLEAAQRAEAKAGAIGARLIVAKALERESDAFDRLGEPDKALSAARQAGQIYSAAGDRPGQAGALYNVGEILLVQGNLGDADKYFAQALDLDQQLGFRPGAASALAAMGRVLELQGDLAQAGKQYEQSLAIRRGSDSRGGVAAALENIARVREQRGDLAGAKQAMEESLQIRRQIADRGGAAASLDALAHLFRLQGNLPAAKQSSDEAVQTYHDLGDKVGEARALLGSASLLSTAGDLVGARKLAGDVLTSFEQSGDKRGAAQARVAIAEIELKTGDFAAAAAAAAMAKDELERDRAVTDAVAAWSTLARAYLAQREFAEATQAIGQAGALLGAGQNREAEIPLIIVAARVHVAAGRSSDLVEAAARLSSVLAEATKLGFVPDQFEVRLTLGEIEFQSGRTAAGRADLAALAREAAARGFLLIAREAAEARGQ